MAAAIILIPEMLSGPGRDSAERQAQRTATGESGNESGIKTYTIDLSQSSPGARPAMPVETTDNRAPPPEVVASETPPAEQPQPEPQVIPESQPVTPADEKPPQRTPAPAVVAETPRPEPRTETPRPAPPKPEPPKTEPRAVASAPAAPRSTTPTATGSKGWAVQLGSYSSEATATRLMNEWRAKGQKSAFVMPVVTGGKTLYRVRIGPSKDRAGAEAVLKTVKASNPNAAVVAHP